MKILLILFLTLSLQADKILLSGLSIHGEDKNIDGTKVNPYNYGIGYQKTYSYDNFDTTATSLLLNDSFNHAMFSLTYGIRKGIDYKGYNFSVGAEFGLTYKKVLFEEINNSIKTYEYNYSIIPVAFIPTLSIQKDDISLDMVYLPQIDYDKLHVMEVILFMIGVKI